MKMFYLVIFLLFFGFFNSAQAVTNTCTAVGGGTWATAVWSGGAEPTALEDAIINSGINISIATAAVCNTLTIGSGGASNTTTTLTVGGSLTVTGDLIFNSNAGNSGTLAVGALTASAAGITYSGGTSETVSLAAGTLTFTNLITLGTNDNITLTGAGTINFNGGLTDGAGVLTTFAACNVNIGGNYTVSSALMTWNATSIVAFTGASIITPTTAITFGNFKTSAAVTLAGDITIAGNTITTDVGGSVSGVGRKITLTNTGLSTMGGTAALATFPIFEVANNANVTMNIPVTVTTLNIAAVGNATDFTIGAAAGTFTATNVNITQPTAAVASALVVGAAPNICNITNLTFIAPLNTASRVARVTVTTGTLNISGTVDFTTPNTTPANQLITVTGAAGIINFSTSVTQDAGTISATNATSVINFLGTAPSLTFGGVDGPSLTGGGDFVFSGNVTVTSTLLMTATADVSFIGTSTITTSANTTFGNFKASAAISLAGDIIIGGTTVTTDVGGSVSGVGMKVTMINTGACTLGGTAALGTFPILEIANNCNVTMNINHTITTLNIVGGANATDLTVGAGTTLTATNVNITQPSAAVNVSLIVGANTCNITNLTFNAPDITAAYVARVTVSTGILTISGTVDFTTPNATAANQTITVTGAAGTINFNNSVVQDAGTISATNATSVINFQGTSPSLNFGGADNPSLTGGGDFVFSGDVTATSTLTMTATADVSFTGTATITPTAAISFGNFKAAAAVTLAGDIIIGGTTVTTDGGTGGVSGVGRKVTMTNTGACTLGGTAALGTFPILEIANNCNVTMNINHTITTLNIVGATTTTDFTIGAGFTLTATNVNITQPAAAFNASLVIGANTCNITNLTFIAPDATAAYVARVTVTSGTLNISGTVDFTTPNATPANQLITVSTGIINFTNPITQDAGTISVTNAAGTINFAGAAPSLTYGGVDGPLITCVANSDLTFSAGLTATTALTLLATCNASFIGAGTITPTAAITFGNFKAAAAVTLAGDIIIGGTTVTTDVGGSVSGVGMKVKMINTGACTLGGTAALGTFPILEIADNCNVTMNTPTTVTTLNIVGATTTTDFTIGVGIGTFTATNVNITQPAAAFNASLVVGATPNICNITNLAFIAPDATAAYVARVTVTSGTLNISGTVDFTTPNATPANQLITVSTGIINFTNPITQDAGTISVTNAAGTINFAGTAPSLTYGGVDGPLLTCVASSDLTFSAGLTATTALTLLATCNSDFNGTGTITPTAAITFGNFKAAAAVTLAGDIIIGGTTVTTDVGGSVSGVGMKVTMINTGACTLGGTAALGTFPILEIADNCNVTMNTPTTVTTLNIVGATTTTDFTIGVGIGTFTATNVNITQPAAAFNASLVVGAAPNICNITNLAFIAPNATAAYVARVTVTTGTLNIGTVDFTTPNATPANQLITVTGAGGIINFANPIVQDAGTISATNATSVVNFAGGAPSLTYGGVDGPLVTGVASSTFTFSAGLTATTALTLLATCNASFIGAGTITPTAAITLGNFITSAAVTLAGDITVAGLTVTINTGGSVGGVGMKFIMSNAAASTIGGTAALATFPILEVTDNANVTMNIPVTVTTLNIATGASTTDFTLGVGVGTFTATNVNINQCTAALNHSLIVGAAPNICNITNLNFIAPLNTLSLVARVTVTTGTLNIAAITYTTPNNRPANQLITVTTGIINFTGSITQNAGTISATGAGTINFAGAAAPSLTFGGVDGPLLTGFAASIFTFSAGLTATTALTFLATCEAQFIGTGTITPTAAITFGNFKAAAAVTLAGDIIIAGTTVTTDGGAGGVSGVGRKVTITNTAGTTLGGTAPFGTFPILEVANNANVTMNINHTITTLNIAATTLATDFTLGALGLTLTVTDVTITQPTAAVNSSLFVNAETCNISGTLTYSGLLTTAGRINQVVVTSGLLTIKTLVFANHTTDANQILTAGSGTITITDPLAFGDGTISVTANGIVNFTGKLTYTGGTLSISATGTANFNAADAFSLNNTDVITFTATSGCILNYSGDITASTVLTYTAGSNVVFFGGSPDIFPTFPITFSKLQINSGIGVTLGGNITVAQDWTNNGGTVSGAFDVTFSGSGFNIKGSSGTAFSQDIIFADGAVYTLQGDGVGGSKTHSCRNLTFAVGGTVSSLTYNADNPVLNVTGTATLNQTTVDGNTKSLFINGGGGTIANLTFVGAVTTSRVFQVVITTGSPIITSLTFASNTTDANQLISVTSTGSVTVTNAFTMADGTIQVTSNGTANFTNKLTMTGGTLFISATGTMNFNGADAFEFNNTSVATITATANSILNFFGNVTATTALALTAGSNFVLNGTATQTIGGAGGLTFSGLEVTNSSATGIVLSNSVIVTTKLTMTDGNVNLNGNTLTLGTAAATPGTLTHAGAAANGWMYGGNFTRFFNTGTIADGNVAGMFPMGSIDNSKFFYVSSPATAITTGGTITLSYNYVAAVSDVTIADDLLIIKRNNSFWTSTMASMLGGDFNILVTGTGMGFANNVADLRLSLAAGVAGSPGTNGGTTTVPTVQRTGVPVGSLSNNFYLASVSSTSPLPINLLSFDAEVNENQVDIKWVTSGEINNDYFSIEKSKNGIDFEDVIKIPGAGNTTNVLDYSTVDSNPYEGISYYRLKQTDFNGDFSYSNLVAVEFKGDKDFSFIVFPNPNNGEQFYVSLPDGLGIEINIIVYDITGNIAYSSMITTINEYSNLSAIDLSQKLKSGIYFIKALHGEKVWNKKLTVL